LIQPYRLLKDHLAISALRITRSPKGIHYEEAVLETGLVRKTFPAVTPAVRNALALFNPEGVKEIKEDIKKRFSQQKAGISFDVYSRNAFSRRIHELFNGIKQEAARLKWYHKLPGDKGSYRTGPCVLLPARPY